MLLSVGDKWGRWTPQVTEANSPMGFLQANFEFECQAVRRFLGARRGAAFSSSGFEHYRC